MSATPPPAAPPPRASRVRLDPEARRAQTVRTRNAVLASAIACVVVALGAYAVAWIGFRQGWVSYAGATRVLIGGTVPVAALLAVALGLLGLVFALVVAPRRGAAPALAAVAAGAAIYAVWVSANAAQAKAPPVHEVATDWRDPLTFSPKTLAARGEKANPIELAPAVPEGPTGAGFLGRPVAEVNARTCPAAVPATLALAPGEAYARVKAVVTADRMALLVDDPASGRLEATVARGALGVRDDLVARVRPEGSGSRVDFRASARQGLSDGGANCERVTRLRERLAK